VNSLNVKTTATQGYAPINGLKMYYEIDGTGDPLVFIPPAFGFAGLHSFPELVQNHSVITIDLQGNGRTADIPDRPISIEHYAKDVVGLLKYLGISKANFLGESYGGNTAAMIAKSTTTRSEFVDFSPFRISTREGTRSPTVYPGTAWTVKPAL